MWGEYRSLDSPFYTYAYINNILKSILEFKKLLQNIQRAFDKTLRLSANHLCIFMHQILFFYLNLFKNYINQLNMNLQPFKSVVIITSVSFCVVHKISWLVVRLNIFLLETWSLTLQEECPPWWFFYGMNLY